MGPIIIPLSQAANSHSEPQPCLHNSIPQVTLVIIPTILSWTTTASHTPATTAIHSCSSLLELCSNGCAHTLLSPSLQVP